MPARWARPAPRPTSMSLARGTCADIDPLPLKTHSPRWSAPSAGPRCRFCAVAGWRSTARAARSTPTREGPASAVRAAWWRPPRRRAGDLDGHVDRAAAPAAEDETRGTVAESAARMRHRRRGYDDVEVLLPAARRDIPGTTQRSRPPFGEGRAGPNTPPTATLTCSGPARGCTAAPAGCPRDRECGPCGLHAGGRNPRRSRSPVARLWCGQVDSQ